METLNNLNPVVTPLAEQGTGANIAIARYLRDTEHRDAGILKMKGWATECGLPEKPILDFRYNGFTCPKCNGHHFGVSAIPSYAQHPDAGKRMGRCHTYGPQQCCDYTWDDDSRPDGIIYEYSREQHNWEGAITNIKRRPNWGYFTTTLQRNEEYQRILRQCEGLGSATLKAEFEAAGAKDWDWESVNEEMVEIAQILAKYSWLRWPSFITALARHGFYIEMFRVSGKITAAGLTGASTMVKIKSRRDGINFITVLANPSMYWYFEQMLVS